MKHNLLILTLFAFSFNLFAQMPPSNAEQLGSFTWVAEQLGNKYLKVNQQAIDGNKYWADVCIQVYDTLDNKLLQTLDTVSVMSGLKDIAMADYNFDGYIDFSIFEQSYAGPNTLRIYYLYDPKTDTFFQSSFTGVSLEFDAAEKRIYERNQCCAGSSVTEAIYKVKNNEMVLIEQHCYQLNMESAESEFGLEYDEVDCN